MDSRQTLVVAAIAQVAKMPGSKKPHTPSDYWNYVRQRNAEKVAYAATHNAKS